MQAASVACCKEQDMARRGAMESQEQYLGANREFNINEIGLRFKAASQ